jgi:phytoene dehydrogenase-like protein
VQELARAAQARGVQIRTSAGAQRVLVDDYCTVGVLLDSGEELQCAAVLSTVDPMQTILHLVDPEWLDPELRNDVTHIKARGHVGIVHYALSRLPRELASDENRAALGGIIQMTPSMTRMERAYDAVKYGELAERPYAELCVPSQRWPQLAPRGKHVLSARVAYVPFHTDPGLLAQRVDAMIEDTFPGFLDVLEQRVALTPRDIAAGYGLSGGCTSHGELTLDQMLFMRPTPSLSQYGTPLQGLWLGGSGSHPGPGISGAAGTMAAKALLRAGAASASSATSAASAASAASRSTP